MSKYIGPEHSARRFKDSIFKSLRHLNDFQHVYPDEFSKFIYRPEIQLAIKQLGSYIGKPKVETVDQSNSQTHN